MKTSNALASHQDIVPIQDKNLHYDYEGELVIIIGKAGKNISREQARDHILGYTIGMMFQLEPYNLEALNGFSANH